MGNAAITRGNKVFLGADHFRDYSTGMLDYIHEILHVAVKSPDDISHITLAERLGITEEYLTKKDGKVYDNGVGETIDEFLLNNCSLEKVGKAGKTNFARTQELKKKIWQK